MARFKYKTGGCPKRQQNCKIFSTGKNNYKLISNYTEFGF